jgi:hypothetical protein
MPWRLLVDSSANMVQIAQTNQLPGSNPDPPAKKVEGWVGQPDLARLND